MTLLTSEADATSFVWLLGTGRPAVTPTPEAPEISALLLWEVTTTASTIVATLDRRTYTSTSRVMTIGGQLPTNPGLVDRLTVVVNSKGHCRRSLADSTRILPKMITKREEKVPIKVLGLLLKNGGNAHARMY